VETIFEWFKSQWTLANDVNRLQNELNELQREQGEHLDLIKQLVFALQQERTERRHENELLMLKLENELLKFERRLPPPRSHDNLPPQ
jgi:hypothetical protein